ncbi:DNA polymerase/3'-5' exonuclease PolX [Halospeciosus flavus]|uniref:DNA polymerase beta n=1 Tax=Halospeciosus flavus TaxID=3032283 RepID=A0ABD5Z5A4_9EURY|nr:DNA polymerase/3'-5' exonuclease PolX [Halospeciosus flavus]
MSRNAEVAERLEEIADLYEAKDVGYKPNMYRRAASNVRDYPEAIEDLAEEGLDAVTEIDQVGDSIGEKIVEYIETGSIERLEELRDEFPVRMQELTSVEGVGPKTAGELYQKLGIQNLDDLEEAARNQEIRELEGFGAKTEENILDHIEFARQAQERDLLGDGRPLADDVKAFLTDVEDVERVEIAGSTRRWRPTIGDIDVLVASDAGESVGEALTEWDRVEETIEIGPTKTSVRASGIRVDLRVVVDEEFGSALQYFTGSADHNITLRNYALRKDLKVNEYGVFDVSDVEDPESGQRVGERLASETEEAVYDALDLPWIPPEIREDRGEVEAAQNDALPDLVTLDDYRGDLHTHTDWSDGDYTLEEMLDAAEERGYDYYAVTDHGEGPGVFGDTGLADDDVLDQLDAVEAEAADRDVEVFTGIETNVDADGNVVEVSDDVLAGVDIVVASPHSGLGEDGGDQTDRLVAAIEHEHVDVLGHPTGRLINDRPAMELDPSELGAAAAEHGVALEINSNPHRLDLWGELVKVAVEEGATVTVNTDAHSPSEFGYTEYGVHTARRGWCEPDDVLNTWDVDEVRDFLG